MSSVWRLRTCRGLSALARRLELLALTVGAGEGAADGAATVFMAGAASAVTAPAGGEALCGAGLAAGAWAGNGRMRVGAGEGAPVAAMLGDASGAMATSTSPAGGTARTEPPAIAMAGPVDGGRLVSGHAQEIMIHMRFA